MAGKTYSGKYKIQNRQKYKGNAGNVTYRSSWELSFMKWCDTNDQVVKWNSEEIQVPYFSRVAQRRRRYFVDFYVKLDDGREFMVEIKPDKYTRPPKKPRVSTKKTEQQYLYECGMFATNIDKWTAGYEYASKKGMKFVILTEHKLRKMGIRIRA